MKRSVITDGSRYDLNPGPTDYWTAVFGNCNYRSTIWKVTSQGTAGATNTHVESPHHHNRDRYWIEQKIPTCNDVITRRTRHDRQLLLVPNLHFGNIWIFQGQSHRISRLKYAHTERKRERCLSAGTIMPSVKTHQAGKERVFPQFSANYKPTTPNLTRKILYFLSAVQAYCTI